MSKFKVGDKVVPHSKSVGRAFKRSDFIAKSTRFVEVVDVPSDGSYETVTIIGGVRGAGEYYSESDLTLYQEPSTKFPKKWGIRNIYPEVRLYLADKYALPEIINWDFENVGWDGCGTHKGCHGARTFSSDVTMITIEEFRQFVTSEKEPSTTRELAELPEKWHIVCTEENRKMLDNWRTCGYYSVGRYILSCYDGQRGFSKSYVPEGYNTEITLEQFKKWVLCEDTSKPKLRVGQWYQNKSWSSSKDYAKATRFDYNIIYFTERIYQGEHAYVKMDEEGDNENSWGLMENAAREVPLEEIQEYLPEDHPDRFDTAVPNIVYLKCIESNDDDKFTVGNHYEILESAPSGDFRIRDNSGDTRNVVLNGSIWSFKFVTETAPGEPKTVIEKWSVGSYIVNINSGWGSSDPNLTIGKVYEIVANRDIAYVKNDIGMEINFIEDTAEERGTLKWFATLQEAEAFSNELLAKTVCETVEDPLIVEARKRYPVGTKFYPAHLALPANLYCTITTDKFHNSEGDLYAIPNIGNGYSSTDRTEGDGNNYSRIIYNKPTNTWAEIVQKEKPVEKPAGKYMEAIYNKANPERGARIIKYLESKGGTNKDCWKGNALNVYWYIDSAGVIKLTYRTIPEGYTKNTDFEPTTLTAPTTEKPWTPSVGDYITITKSKVNWDPPTMDDLIGDTYKVTRSNGDNINFNEDKCKQWNYAQGHFRQATPEEILSVTSPQPTSTVTVEPEQKGEVVHCTTQEEWDTVLSVFNPIKLDPSGWGKDICVNLTVGRYGSRSYYEAENYTIISFQEWCTRNGVTNTSIEVTPKTIELELKEETELLKPVKAEINISSKLLII